jgi:hypothetical protein
MDCPPGLEFNKPYTLEEIKQAMRRRLIDNSYVGEWLFDEDQKIDQYAAYASKDLKKGEIVMECLIPYQWLYQGTETLKDYRIRVEYKNGDVRDIMPLGDVLAMNYGKDKIEANCKVRLPDTPDDRILTVIARNDIQKDEELRWLYVGNGKEI